MASSISFSRIQSVIKQGKLAGIFMKNEYLLNPKIRIEVSKILELSQK